MLTIEYDFTHPRLHYKKCIVEYKPGSSENSRIYHFISHTGDDILLKGKKGKLFLDIQKKEEAVLFAADGSADEFKMYMELNAAWKEFERLCRSQRKI